MVNLFFFFKRKIFDSFLLFLLLVEAFVYDFVLLKLFIIIIISIDIKEYALAFSIGIFPLCTYFSEILYFACYGAVLYINQKNRRLSMFICLNK